MKKTFFLFITLLVLVKSYSFSSYRNPFLNSDGNKIVLIGKKIRPSKLILKVAINYINSRTLGSDILFETDSSLDFGSFLSFANRLRLDYNGIKVFDAGISFIPLCFLKINVDYNIRPFREFKVIEHNIFLDIAAVFDRVKYFTIEFDTGFDFKFSDLDIGERNKKYKENWIFNMIFIWKISLLFNPLSFYSFGLSIGNRNSYEVFSFNYIEYEFVNYFHLPKNLSIFIKGSFAYAGAMPFAGIIDRFSIKSGLRYEVNFKY